MEADAIDRRLALVLGKFQERYRGPLTNERLGKFSERKVAGLGIHLTCLALSFALRNVIGGR